MPKLAYALILRNRPTFESKGPSIPVPKGILAILIEKGGIACIKPDRDSSGFNVKETSFIVTINLATIKSKLGTSIS